MKAILLMFDSLNRHMLSAYGCDWTHTPNFRRLAQRTVRFERAYVGSMPCMPARREIHTGRPDLLHRSWGLMEPFDDSVPQMLQNAGVHTHLASDHYHYWEEHSGNYHTKYGTWEFFRGQEGDAWIGQVAEPEIPPHRNGKGRRQDWVNRPHMRAEEEQPGPQTIRAGIEHMRRNREQDKWFLHIECFDPHEPWFAPRKYRDLYPRRYQGPLFDWPGYRPVSDDEGPQVLEEARYQYAALLSMCDAHLGDVLDAMDELDLWKDTMLIVNTDHGFMLGESKPDSAGAMRGCWAKNWQPWYEELSHVPLFIHDPRCPAPGATRRSLVQTIDLGPTLLEFFGVGRTSDMMGVPLRDTIAHDAPVRPAGIFGGFGGHVNVTDGRHVYMRAPVNADGSPLYEYTLMPVNLRRMPEQARAAELVKPFAFSKGYPLLRYRVPQRGSSAHKFGHLLFDLEADPRQQRPLQDPALEQTMRGHLLDLMRQCDAPAEQYKRLGLRP
jgi:arylsulfatase A-like enzyme